MDFVVKVECVDISKKGKLQLYVLQVTWSNQKVSRVGRPYTEFFDYRTKLRQESKRRSDVTIPDLPGIKSFERSIFSKDAKKRRKIIEDFCQSILSQPSDFAQSTLVTEFYSAERSSLRSIELCPDSLTTIPMGDDILEQLRCHALTDNKGAQQAVQRLESVKGHDPAPGVLMRSNSDTPSETVHYTATSDYAPQRDNEVTLRQGDVVDVLQKDLAGWWFVHVEDSDDQGWAPGSLLEPTNPFLDTNVPAQNSDGTTLYMATTSYTAANADEISCDRGQLVEVTEHKMDGWWKVRRDGKEGLMPAIHLEPVSKQGGQTKRLKSSLYHHNSIYRKSDPPPRRSARVVVQPSANQKDLLYAEIAFTEPPSAPRGSHHPRPVILGDSSRTQYTEVIPISLPVHKPTGKCSGDKSQEKTEAKPPDPSPASDNKPPSEAKSANHTQSSSDAKRPNNYQNWRAKPNLTGYLNVEIGKSGPKMETQVYEVTADHDCVSMKTERLEVRKGDFVQAEKVEAHRALCGLMNDDGNMKNLRGWVPMDKLKSIYTAAKPASGPPKLESPMHPPPPLSAHHNIPAVHLPQSPAQSPAHASTQSSTHGQSHGQGRSSTHGQHIGPTHGQSHGQSQVTTHPQGATHHLSQIPPDPHGPKRASHANPPPQAAIRSSAVSPVPLNSRAGGRMSTPPQAASRASAVSPTPQSRPRASTGASRGHPPDNAHAKHRPASHNGGLRSDKRGKDLPPEPSLPSPDSPNNMDKSPPVASVDTADTVIVCALWAYERQRPGELSFSAGDEATLLCQNNRGWWGVLRGQDRGWVPSAYWQIKQLLSTPAPVTQHPSPDPPPRSPTDGPPTPGAPPSAGAPRSKKHHDAHLKQRWFVGKMSRTDCEGLFTEHARERDFVIRESTYRVGHYTLTVQYDGRQRHFPIILTDDDKYFIGKHNFKNLVNIVHYYQKNPLIFGTDGSPQPLGEPLLISQC